MIRAMPFGVFVDVGLDTDALIPTPHIGAHPGIEPATVAPIGAVVQARVLEVIPEKRRLTLSMRPDRAIFDPAAAAADPGATARAVVATARGDAATAARAARQARARAKAARAPVRAARRPGCAAGGQGGQGGRGGGPGGGAGGRPQRKPQRQGGKFGGGTGGVSDIFSGRRNQERGLPRRISLGPDDGKPKDGDAADEASLTPGAAPRPQAGRPEEEARGRRARSRTHASDEPTGAPRRVRGAPSSCLSLDRGQTRSGGERE